MTTHKKLISKITLLLFLVFFFFFNTSPNTLSAGIYKVLDRSYKKNDTISNNKSIVHSKSENQTETTKDSLEIKDSLNSKQTFEKKSEQAILPENETKTNSISDVVIKIDNNEYYYLKDNLQFEGETYLFFTADSPQAVAQIKVYPKSKGSPIKNFKLLELDEYKILDSLVFIDNEYYTGRIRFNNLIEAKYPSLIFNYSDNEAGFINKEIKLMPYFTPKFTYDDSSAELFRGEEKSIVIGGENLFNIKISADWKRSNSIEYRLIRDGRNLRLSVRADKTGKLKLPLELKTNNPIINEEGEVTQTLQTINFEFNVKPSRLVFVNTDKEYVFFEQDRRQSEEIRIDYHSNFELKKNYRIEDKQEPGGTLIAEIFIKSITSDNKVLADIKTYDLHRIKDGYLYIKDGSRTMFMTNFNIVNKPEISKIEILREGGDWTSSLNVYPGEKIEVKIEGNGLYDAEITFDGCNQNKDSVRVSDKVIFYDVSIPIDIPRKKIMVFLNKNITSHELMVREYKRPADLEFVEINYGTRNYAITNKHFNQAVFYDKTIKDINIVFNSDKIDYKNKLYGKQYLTIEIRILDDKNKLLDLQTISNIVVCPGESSPRHAFYGDSDCKQQSIRINDHLLRKTYNLDAFSQIIITIKHNENHYSKGGKTQKASIFVERKIGFDIMVSFPAGLLVKEFSESGIGNLSGISTSVLAEISFYDPNRIGAKKPYKFGVGFIALNAFNFGESENIKRDIGIVSIAVIEPIRGNAKFSVPIYFGVGYLLKENDFFAIFGPGIRLHF